MAKVNLHDFKRAFVKRYDSEAAFLQRFHRDLAEALAPGAATESPVFTVVLEGVVRESTAKGEFLHPNQSKLANAVAGVQRHLVDYLRGRLPVEHIAPPTEPSASNAK